ncbi:MAG: hypothetical protein WC554_00895, partial [Clostridia bacterium]
MNIKKIMVVLLAGALAAGTSLALVTEKTNKVDLVLANVCDGSFNDFNFQISGYDDQKFAFRYDQDLTGVTCVFRITKPIQGTIYYDVPAGSITVSGTNVSWSIARTNIPPPGNYYGELLSYETGATTNFYRSLAQGKLPVTWSLYLNDQDYFINYKTNAVAGYVYVHPNWVDPDGLWETTGTVMALSNYVVYADGILKTNINILSNHVETTYAKQVDYAATSNDVDTVEGLAALHTGQIGAISNDLDTAENTIGLHTSQIGGLSNKVDTHIAEDGVTTNTGNWAGTWQDNDPSYFRDWENITNTPASIVGYGITNDIIYEGDSRLTDARTPLAHDQDWSTITGTPDTISGYGITDAWTKVESDARFGTTGSAAAVQADLADHKTNVNVHAIAAVSGLQTALDGKASTGDMAAAEGDISDLSGR